MSVSVVGTVRVQDASALNKILFQFDLLTEQSFMTSKKHKSGSKGKLASQGKHNSSVGRAKQFISIIKLFHRKWAAPVLAELYADKGAKAVTLTNRLCISRESLRCTLEELIENGWVLRNPGYGHPMRPEYLLTKRGAKLAPICLSLMKTIKRAGVQRIALLKWSMPIALAIGSGVDRFGKLKRTLPGITARALTLGLKEMQSAGLVDRRILDQYPPTSSYSLTPKGRRILPILQSL